MSKGSTELTALRKEEIIKACEKLYQTMSFKDITLREISKVTSFSRPTIYNYFQTKEEIFLALFKKEYDLWNIDLEKILNKDKLSRNSLVKELSNSISNRKQLLKLLAMNNYDMEANSSIEELKDFKVAYGKSINNVKEILKKHTKMTKKDINNFIYMFFPFMFGIYPYTEVTNKQRKAMKDVNVDYTYMTIYEITYAFLNKLMI